MTGDPFRNTSGRRNVDLSMIFKNPKRQQDLSLGANQITPPEMNYPGATQPGAALPAIGGVGGTDPGQDDNPYTRLIAAISGTDVGSSKAKKPAWMELVTR